MIAARLRARGLHAARSRSSPTTTRAIQGFVAAGVGVALIAELALTTVRDDIVIRSLGRETPMRRIHAAVLAAATARRPPPRCSRSSRTWPGSYRTRRPDLELASAGAAARGFGTTIFTEMSALAERTGSINLGQGFPDEDGPAEVIEAAVAALRAGAQPVRAAARACRRCARRSSTTSAAATGSSSIPTPRCR